MIISATAASSVLLSGCSPDTVTPPPAASSESQALPKASLGEADKATVLNTIKQGILAFESADREGLLKVLTGQALSEFENVNQEDIAADAARQKKLRGEFQAVSITDVIVATPEIRTVRASTKYSSKLEGAISIYELRPVDGVWKIATLEAIPEG